MGHLETDLNMMSTKKAGDSTGHKHYLTSVIDSGAARSVCPPSHGSQFKINPTVQSLRGDGFKTATGKRVVNQGSRKVRGVTAAGAPIEMQYAVADINSALDSVSQICDAGATVTFTKTGGWILTDAGARTEFERKGDTYTRTVFLNEVTATPGRITPATDFIRQRPTVS